MHRTRLARILGAALLAMALVMPSAGTAAAATPAAATLPRISLGCSLVVPNPLTPIAPNRSIVCKWAAPAGVTVRAYRLWRSVDAGVRHLIATIPSTKPLLHRDFAVRTGHAYHYVVVGIGPAGTRVAVSARVTVRVGVPPETLRLACALLIDTNRRGVICRWSDAVRPAARRYVLFRSVDGAARQAIYRVGEDGRRSYFDGDVKPGQVIRYAVVALNAGGRIVGWGGPDRVVIPSWVTAAK